MDRFDFVIIGAGLIGFVAGEMAWEDGALAAWTSPYPQSMKYVPAVACAIFVVVLGQWLAKRAGAARPAAGGA